MQNLVKIDGSLGEGGGQVLRTALSLSIITNTPIHLYNIRAGRKKTGLMRQHLVCVESSARLANAHVEGAGLGSQEIIFRPQQAQAGYYEFNIGSAGSTFLVLQTLLPILMLQDSPSTLIISGGTHNPLAPTAEFIERSFFPMLAHLGIDVQLQLKQAGFAPVGGGQIEVRIQPWQQRQALNLVERGEIVAMNAYAGCLNLDDKIAMRELDVLQQKLALNESRLYHLNGISQGNHVFVEVKTQQHSQVFTALGEFKKSAELIARQLANRVADYVQSGAVADEYLTDQLLLPLALGKGGTFTAQMISEHTRTQAEMIQRFLDVKIEFVPLNKIWQVHVSR